MEQARAMRSSLQAKPNGNSKCSMCFLLLTVLSPLRLMYFLRPFAASNGARADPVLRRLGAKKHEKLDVWMRAAQIPTEPI